MTNVPEIRFKGFTDAWEQRKLGEVLKVNSGKDYKHLNAGNIPVYGTGGYMLSVEESLSEADAIGIGRKGTIDKPQFLTAPFWTVDTLFFMTPLQDNILSFLHSLSQNIEWSKMDESTGVPSLSKVNIENVDIHVPKSTEQTSIGNFFRTLDNIITLYKRKLDELQELKKAYLQVMFPQEGEAMPKVRFAGFNENWETIKLGDVFEQTVRYVNPKEQNIELWSLTIENGLTPKTERYNREFLVKKDDAFKSVMPEEFIYNPMNMTLGAVDLNKTKQEVAVSGYYITMQTRQNYCNRYFAVWLKSPMAINLFKVYATGGLIEKQRVQFPTFAQIHAPVPSLPEQVAIGKLFSALDEQIANANYKLEKMKYLKIAYLQKMFI